LLSVSETNEIREKVFSVEQWIQLFGILEDQAVTRLKIETKAFSLEGGAGQVPKNLVDVSSVAARVARAVDFQTPRKLAAVDKTFPIKLELPTRLTILEELPDDTEAAVGQDVWATLLGANWNKLVGVVGVMEATLPVVQSQCVNMFEGLSTMLEGVEDKANALGLVLGQRGPQMDAEGTVWDAIARSISLATNLGEVVNSLSADMVTIDKTTNQVVNSLKDHVGDV
jgi:hypothetical protein